LNSLLSDELTAISQYMVHSEMCANWGYEKLHKDFQRPLRGLCPGVGLHRHGFRKERRQVRYRI